MTRKEYESRLAELQTQIDELKNTEIEEEMPTLSHPRWKPMIYDAYYYIYGNEAHRTFWSNDNYDMETYSVGNVFQTKEEAEFAIERLKVLVEMREWAGKWDDPYIIMYSGDEKVCHVHEMAFHFLNGGGMRFATQEDAENCIQAVGEDKIKKYYFMIPEETRI